MLGTILAENLTVAWFTESLNMALFAVIVPLCKIIFAGPIRQIYTLDYKEEMQRAQKKCQGHRRNAKITITCLFCFVFLSHCIAITCIAN